MPARPITILAIALYGLLVPAGLLLRLVRDPLGLRRACGWQPARSRPPSLARARRLD